MNAATLRLLIDRARASSEQAQARHAALRRAEEQARGHLSMLRNYAGEYEERARARTGDARDPSADRNQEVFLARLQIAIDTQASEVQTRADAAAAAAQDVSACLQRQKSLQTLALRRAQQEQQIAGRREQKSTDEFAQRARERARALGQDHDTGSTGREP